eukprot:814732-Pleurochrysis_carterae.AAC.1
MRTVASHVVRKAVPQRIQKVFVTRTEKTISRTQRSYSHSKLAMWAFPRAFVKTFIAVLVVGHSLGLEQQLCTQVLAVLASKHQTGRAILVSCIGCGLGLEQSPHTRFVAVLACEHQTGQAILPSCVGSGLGLEQSPRTRFAA